MGVWGLGLGARGGGALSVEDFGAQGLGVGVQGSGFRVQGLGLRGLFVFKVSEFVGSDEAKSTEA